MNTKEAKDFLVGQAAEQAALDRVPLSELEQRMAYFTESDPESCADPIALNTEFEEKCDTAEYEAKMARLFRHAWERVKGEGGAKKQTWEEAIRTLRRGDHYLLILWDENPSGERPKGDFLKLVGTATLIVAAVAGGAFVAAKYDIKINPRGFIYGAIAIFVLCRIYGRSVLRFFGIGRP